MAVLLDSFQESVGSIKDWLRASSAVALPANWLILDGSTVADPDSQYNGLALPDSRAMFHQGHPTLTNLTFGADTTYHAGAGGVIPTGGQASLALAHTHPAGTHTHSVAGHTHSITAVPAHTHNVGGHSHSVPAHSHGMTHLHTVPSFQTTTQTNLNNTVGGPFSTIQGAFYPSHDHTVPSINTQNFSGNTNSGGNGTDFGGGGGTDAQNAHDHSGLTGTGSGNTGAGAGNTDTSLGAFDNTPPWLGMLKIIKVK